MTEIIAMLGAIIPASCAVWLYRQLKKSWRQLESNYRLLARLNEQTYVECMRAEIWQEMKNTLEVMGES